MSRGRLLIAVWAAIGSAGTVWSATPYQELLSKAPSDANALVMISTAEVRASAVAMRELAPNAGRR